MCTVCTYAECKYALAVLQPEWKLADPICTFLFSILVIISTLTVMRDALRVIMEGAYVYTCILL